MLCGGVIFNFTLCMYLFSAAGCRLEEVSNGWISPVDTMYIAVNETANYTCNAGYLLTAGNDSRFCDNGTLTGVAPNCTGRYK